MRDVIPFTAAATTQRYFVVLFGPRTVAAAEASANAQSDLQSLRDDFSRLAEQVADILANRGNAAWQRAKVSVDDAVSGAQETGQDAADALREASDHFVEAVDESIKTHPYTTLAIAAGLGFLFGTAWRR